MSPVQKARSDTRKVIAGRCAGADVPRFGPTSGPTCVGVQGALRPRLPAGSLALALTIPVLGYSEPPIFVPTLREIPLHPGDTSRLCCYESAFIYSQLQPEQQQATSSGKADIAFKAK